MQGLVEIFRDFMPLNQDTATPALKSAVENNKNQKWTDGKTTETLSLINQLAVPESQPEEILLELQSSLIDTIKDDITFRACACAVSEMACFPEFPYCRVGVCPVFQWNLLFFSVLVLFHYSLP